MNDLKKPPQGATVPPILRWLQQDAPRMPEGQPEGLLGFDSPPLGTVRSYHLRYPGNVGETRCTIEQTRTRAWVCFHDLPDNRGGSVDQVIAKLATGVKDLLLPQLPPESVRFFNYTPPSAGDECFRRVDMDWRNGHYEDPVWQTMDRVPQAILRAGRMPYDAVLQARRPGARQTRVPAGLTPKD